MSKRKHKFDACPECVVRENDYAEKRLYKCKFCGRRFCHRHLKPRLVDIPVLKYASQDVAWQRLVEEADRRKSHPDFQFTRQKFTEMVSQEEGILQFLADRYCFKCGSKKIKPSEEALYFICLDCGNRWKLGEGHWRVRASKPRLRSSDKMQLVKKKSSPKLGNCPKCGSGRTITTAYREEYDAFECLDCQHKWKHFHGVSEGDKRKRKIPIKKIVAFLLIVIILGFALWNAPSIFSTLQRLTGFQPSSTYSHEELVTYALSLINSDRSRHGVSSVSLSAINSGQKHADNMFTYHFFSHWDTNGYKPYMRYTLAGGKGSVAENVAWQYSSSPFDVKEAIKSLEWQMMYNDSNWNWRHRDNILNSFHNKVSIGIAYDNNNVYFVQDFENDYISWSTMSIAQNGEVLMSGSFRSRELSLESVNIFYDPLPSNLTSDQLEKAPYNGGYGAGTFVGMALPSGWESVEGITITAQTWVQTSSTFQIRFNLSSAFNAHGKGVYTLYLQPDPDMTEDSLTTYSFRYN